MTNEKLQRLNTVSNSIEIGYSIDVVVFDKKHNNHSIFIFEIDYRNAYKRLLPLLGEPEVKLEAFANFNV